MTKYVFKPDMKKLISLDTGGLDTLRAAAE